MVEPIHPLRAWRVVRGFTLEEAAKCVGAGKQAWLDWERGRRIPSRVFMTRIYRATGGTISADRLYWPEGYPHLTVKGSGSAGHGKGEDDGGLEAAA
jgi:transcriptional regulator with XRE-family HTH domain